MTKRLFFAAKGPSLQNDCAQRTATVTASGPEGLRLRLDPSEGDAGADAGCRACAVRGLCRGGREGGGAELSLPPRPGLTPGDRVRVSYRAPNRATAAAALFLPTLAGLAAGAGAAWALWPGRDGLFLTGCGAGFLAGAAATFLANRRARRTAAGAEVVKAG